MGDDSTSGSPLRRLTANVKRQLAPLLEHGSWSLAWGLFLALALTVAIHPRLDVPDVYPEPAGGIDAWEGYAKGGDFRTVWLLLIAGTAFAAASAWVVARAAGTGTHRALRRSAAHRVLLVAALPAIAWLARMLLEPKQAPGAPAAAGLWLLAGHLVLWIVARLEDRLDHEQLQRCALTLLGAAFVAQFAAAALGLWPVRIWPDREFRGTALAAVGWGASTAALVAGAWLARAARGDASRFHDGLVRLALHCQLALPLLLVGLIPTAFASPFGGTHSEAGWPLVAFVGAGVVAAMAGWVRTWRSLRRQERLPAAERDAFLAFSPLPLAALAVFLAAPRWNIPLLPVDDWHFGERWITWQQWVQFGKVPFVDTMPTFGFYGPLVGLLAKFGFEPTVAGWLSAEVLLKALLAGGCCLGAFAVGGPAAAFFVLMWPAFTDRLMMFAPCALLLATPALLARPLLWLLCWPAACLLAIAFNPPSGVALALASTPVVAWMAWRSRPTRRTSATAAEATTLPRALAAWRSPAALAASIWAAVALVFILTTPAWAMVRGLLDYVRTNGELYSLHAGSALALVLSDGAPDVLPSASARLLWLGGWIAIAVVVAGVLAREWLRSSATGSKPDAARTVLGWLSLGACLLLIRWAVTRLGLDGWTRAGVVTFTWLSALLPPLLLRGTSRQAQVPALAVLTALLAPFALPYPAQSTSAFLGGSAMLRTLSKGQTVVDGSQIGLPMLGTLAVEDRKHLAALQEMRRLVDAHTEPGAPMFDLANRPALYAYTGRAMAARYSSSYYLGNDRLQRQVLRDLQRNPPAAVFFGPSITHGEGPATVRSFRVAKQLLLHSHPVERGDAVLLIPDPPSPTGEQSRVDPRELSARLAILDRVIISGSETSDCMWLGLVPATWGQSWRSMADGFLPAGSVRVTDAGDQDDRTWGMGFDGGPVAGQDVDFLRVEIAWSDGPADPRTIDLAWTINGREPARPLRCELPRAKPAGAPSATDGERRAVLVIPVGSHPRWLFSPALEGVVVRPAAEGMLTAFRLVGATALRLRD